MKKVDLKTYNKYTIYYLIIKLLAIMVCFAQFLYKISKKDIDNFIVNAGRYFPGTKWKVTCGDMTISTMDLQDAVRRLNPSDHDIVEFDTGRIWDSLSFWKALPPMKTCEVSQEMRQRLAQQVKLALNPDDHKAENVGQQFDWSTVNQFMTLVHEQSPLVSYVALPSCGMILYESTTRHHESGLECIHLVNGTFEHPYAPHIIFDMDDGFINQYGEVPDELTTAFTHWVDGGRVGPVLG